jgi:SOS-response transcriptional repressor LexA
MSRAEVDGLSPRQRLVLEVIGDYWTTYGHAPSVRDVARLVGLVPSATAYQLGQLEAAGRITRTPRISRSMRVVQQDGAAA